MPRPRQGSNLSIAQLESLLETRRSKLSQLHKERSALMKDLQAVDSQITALGGSARGMTAGGRVQNKVSLNESIASVLKSASGAMRVGDIVDAVKASGYRSNSANFRGIVNQTLIKDPRFAKADERGTYRLKK